MTFSRLSATTDLYILPLPPLLVMVTVCPASMFSMLPTIDESPTRVEAELCPLLLRTCHNTLTHTNTSSLARTSSYEVDSQRLLDENHDNDMISPEDEVQDYLTWLDDQRRVGTGSSISIERGTQADLSDESTQEGVDPAVTVVRRSCRISSVASVKVSLVVTPETFSLVPIQQHFSVERELKRLAQAVAEDVQDMFPSAEALKRVWSGGDRITSDTSSALCTTRSSASSSTRGSDSGSSCSSVYSSRLTFTMSASENLSCGASITLKGRILSEHFMIMDQP